MIAGKTVGRWTGGCRVRRLSTLCPRHVHIRQIYMQFTSYSRDALAPPHSLALSFARAPSLLIPLRPRAVVRVRARTQRAARPYNSNVRPLFDWYSHARYYFYTCDTASVPRDKGYMTTAVGRVCR